MYCTSNAPYMNITKECYYSFALNSYESIDYWFSPKEGVDQSPFLYSLLTGLEPP